MAVDAEIGKEIEELLELYHVGFLVDGGVSRDLVAEDLRHADGENAFLENALPLHDQVVRPFQSVEVHVPIHPAARRNGRFRRIFRSLPDNFRVLFRNQTFRDQLR